MQSTFGLSPDEGIPMWVADMDFRPPEVVQEALERMVRHGIYGYYKESTCVENTQAPWSFKPNLRHRNTHKFHQYNQ
jgi:cystathionine beta-lyase